MKDKHIHLPRTYMGVRSMYVCAEYTVCEREHVYVYVCVHARVLILVEARDHPQVSFLRVKF